MSGVAHNPEDSPDLPSSNGPSEDTSSSLGWAGIQAHLDTYDEGKKKGAVEDIDTLLVFAGLFSAILTAFVVQTYPMLQPNSSDTTNQLLIMNNQLLLYGLTAPIPLPHGRIPPSLNASAALATQSSTAPASARSINILFFFSLVLSLAAALFGISAKQWLREFMLWNSPLAKPRENIIVRQMRFEDWEAWNVDATIAAIPALLEIAMILFLIGMIILLWTLDDIVAIALSTIVAAFLLAVSAFTVLPVLFLRCPYRSPTAMVCLRLLNLVRVPIPYGAQLLREAARVYAARWARAAKHRREAHPDWMTGYPHDDVENSSRQASPHFAISSTPPGGRNDSPAEIPPETLPANSDSPLSSRPSSQLDTQRPSPLLPIRLRPRRIPRLCIRIAFVVQCSWDIVYHPCDTPANTDRESPSTGQDDVGSPSFHRIPWPRYPQNWRNLDLDSRSATRVTTGRWWAPWRHVLCHAMEALDYETATSVHDALLGRNIISQASEHDAMALLVDISEIAYLVRALTWVSNSSNAPAIQDYIDMAVMTAHSDGHSCLPLGTKMVTMWTMISAGERNSPLHLLRSLFDAHNILTLREASGTYVEQFGRRIVSISSDEPGMFDTV
ncbi:hypothetical protein PsYK624_099830 [Phanerochaete sordida]|uniref:DUF6535 domain-containing protein n=1 Tax=Phanerochaete sordida TaxID=48140 RepID=A0A9P3LG09_9APHY|nr:hypothetical protein PsYK624_099830 [Phanerochaete sordida]